MKTIVCLFAVSLVTVACGATPDTTEAVGQSSEAVTSGLNWYCDVVNGALTGSCVVNQNNTCVNASNGLTEHYCPPGTPATGTVIAGCPETVDTSRHCGYAIR